jgi:hypothetical protein
MGAGAIVAVVLLIVGSCGGYIAVDKGYVPVKDLVGTGLTTLSAVPPPGEYSEITIEEVREQYHGIAEKIATQMPHYNDILIKLYVTNASLHEVASFYHTALNAKDFVCVTNGHLDAGNIDLGVIPIYYYGYEKGLTAAGVVMSDNIPGKTLVLYTTGYSSYYGDIISWLEQQKVTA